MRVKWWAHLATLRARAATRLRAVSLAYAGASGVAAGALVLAVLLTPLGAALQESVGEPLSRLFGLSGFPATPVASTNPGQASITAGLTEAAGQPPDAAPDAGTLAEESAPETDATLAAETEAVEGVALPTPTTASTPAPAPTLSTPTAGPVVATPTPGVEFGSLAMAPTLEEDAEGGRPTEGATESAADVPSNASGVIPEEPAIETPPIPLPPTPTPVVVIPPPEPPPDVVTEVVETIEDTVEPGVETVGDTVESSVETVEEAGETLAETGVASVEDGAETAVDTIEGTTGAVLETTEQTMETTIEVVQATAVPVVATAVAPVATAVVEPVSTTVAEPVATAVIAPVATVVVPVQAEVGSLLPLAPPPTSAPTTSPTVSVVPPAPPPTSPPKPTSTPLPRLTLTLPGL